MRTSWVSQMYKSKTDRTTNATMSSRNKELSLRAFTNANHFISSLQHTQGRYFSITDPDRLDIRIIGSEYAAQIVSSRRAPVPASLTDLCWPEQVFDDFSSIISMKFQSRVVLGMPHNLYTESLVLGIIETLIIETYWYEANTDLVTEMLNFHRMYKSVP